MLMKSSSLTPYGKYHVLNQISGYHETSGMVLTQCPVYWNTLPALL